ncbi:hypothetical protein FHT00_002043 [Sphingomonas insulae]|nr:hypothetical protein [Sphingomonas insulae]
MAGWPGAVGAMAKVALIIGRSRQERRCPVPISKDRAVLPSVGIRAAYPPARAFP